ncbi:MAG: ATP-dependent DNA helicase RecG, partial [Pseudomonadota bacterium]
MQERLARLGIHSVQDVLFHLPMRYEDRTRIQPIGALRAGDSAVIQGSVDHAEIRFGRRRSLLVHLSDGSGGILLRFFHFTAAQRAALQRGARLQCFGEVRHGPASLEVVHPEYRLLGEGDAEVADELTPVYPTTEGLQQRSWRDLTAKALALLNEGAVLREWLPASRGQGGLSIADAVRLLHRPPPQISLAFLAQGHHPAQLRLAFEELVAHQLSLRLLRREQRSRRALPLAAQGELSARLMDALPFRLTGAQRRVADEILDDLSRPVPMQRLVQGDVGSGKTVVAALAAVRAVESGCQVAVMSPTELLAEQHLHNFHHWCAPLGIGVAGLTGRHKGRTRRGLLDALETGHVDLVVGTQALFQEDVVFRALGLVIIDEQHRFGVHQRLALHRKGEQGALAPHQLIMTATPIPRTLAMTAYADLDLSVIDELPPGRTPVVTVMVSDRRRQQVIERVREACAGGRQAYWVCTLISESEVLQAQAAEETAAQLVEQLPGLSIALVHGRMKAA